MTFSAEVHRRKPGLVLPAWSAANASIVGVYQMDNSLSMINRRWTKQLAQQMIVVISHLTFLVGVLEVTIILEAKCIESYCLRSES